jgi:hypothetical protein
MKRIFLALAILLVATTVAATARDSYVLHFGGNRNTMVSGSLQDFLAIRGQLDGDYLWVRRGGRTYVITDRGRLAEVWDYFAAQRALRPEQKDVERQTRKLERESDALEDAGDDGHRLTRAEQARLEELHAQEKELARREQALDDREEELERIAERKLWQFVDRSIDNGSARAIR